MKLLTYAPHPPLGFFGATGPNVSSIRLMSLDGLIPFIVSVSVIRPERAVVQVLRVAPLII